MIKAFFEVYKILNKIGIKPKDVIGMGGDIVKMGKSLFNTRVNPKLLEFIAKNDKIPAKILENIKLHARTLKNTTESQKNLFLENIKSIQKAKTPIKIPKSQSPVTSVYRPGSSGKELPAWTKGWTPRVIKGGKDGLATGGIANHFRERFEDGTEIEGPELPENNKKSLDEIVAGVVGKREDRPDRGMKGFKGGPRARQQGLSAGSVEDKANALFKSMIYVAKNSDKETANTLYSAFDGMLNFNIKNEATGIEQDLAEKLVAGKFKIEEGIPTRIDENTVLDIALQTFETLPNDLQLTILGSTNLAKDESWSALLEGNNLGIEYNSDKQKIEGYYDVHIDSETLKPIIIRPMFTKDNINDVLTKELFIGQGDFPPNSKDYPNEEMFVEAMSIWNADKNKEYFAIDLISEPALDHKGARTAFATKNISGWAAIETTPGFNLFKTEGTIDLPNVLVEDKPIELSSSFYKDLDTEDKEAVIRADIPISESFTPYVEKTTGDWENELQYGINLDKTGKIGNWDTYLTGNIDQDKDYNLQAGIGTDFMGGTAGIDGYYDADGNWQAFAGLKWTYGDGKKKDETYQTTDVGEAYDYLKNMATGGIANHFRARFKPGGIVEPGVSYYARKSPTKINEELFTKIDDLIADAGRAGQVLGKKGLGEGLGYKVVEKGKTSGQGGLNKIIKAWEKARDKTFTFKPAKFTANSPKVKQVIELFENGMSKNAIEFKTGISRKEIRTIFHQFAPEYIGDKNLPSGEGKNAVKKRRLKLIKEMIAYWKDKPGGKEMLEKMNQKLRSIKLKNAEILKMSDEAILNNKMFREAMNLDVKGLKIGEGINFNRYKHLTDAEYIAKVKALAATNQFFQPEHFIAINKKNPASMLPKNIYTAVGKTGPQLEVLKNFVLMNPDDVRTKDINKFLKNQNLLEKKSVLKKAFNLAKSVTKPVLKKGLKLVPIVGTYLGLQDVAKAQEMGLNRPEELFTAYHTSPEIAKGWKDIREYDYKDRAEKEWENIQESWKNRGTGTEETVEVEDEVMFAKGGIASLKK